jgi:hypothetical protein
MSASAAGAIDQGHALAHLRAAFRDQRLDLLGGLTGALRQGADFLRHYGEAAARIAGTCRFDSGIEGEQVCLESDLFDQPDDFADALRGLLDASHGFRRFQGNAALPSADCRAASASWLVCRAFSALPSR